MILIHSVGDGHREVFPQARQNNKFLLTATYYFTKWVEAESLAQIREVHVIKFTHKYVLSRFSIPKAFVSDNGT